MLAVPGSPATVIDNTPDVLSGVGADVPKRQTNIGREAVRDDVALLALLRLPGQLAMLAGGSRALCREICTDQTANPLTEDQQ